jgi:phosphotransacetylase/acyl dehydratase
MVENRTFDEIELGDSADLVRTMTQDDIDLFAIVSGDLNPSHLDPAFARSGRDHAIVGYGMWIGALISAVLGTRLPGAGTTYMSQDLAFLAPVEIGDTVITTVTALAKSGPDCVTFACRCVNGVGVEIATGTARVQAPTLKVRRPRMELPGVQLSRHRRFRELLARAAQGPAITVAVAHPCDAASLEAAVEAADAGLIEPILVGPVAKIRAAAAAGSLVRAGEAGMLMKGSLHTDELMHAVASSDTGLRTARRLSHVYLIDVPSYPRPLLVTDAAINIAPTLDDKRDIVQNAIDLAHIIGIARPLVAILSAVETINPAIRSTVEAAALCKMAERGQITGGVVDGPLAFDNAVSVEAARQKGIVSEVAGRADILVVPDLEAGNMLAKQLSFLAGADAAGVVLGARVPIILTSRADSERTRVASCAVAVLIARSVASAGE